MARATALPTYRAHNEQAMAHAAIAFAKASRRRRMMACTTSIGPGATNMVTAAAVAHVDRLPVLLLPGDVFANRRPDPVLQQIEDFGDGTVSANDCFRPVSRYFDRIARPEQIVPALQRAMAVLTDPAECGPVTLALCQDAQAEAYDYPESFFDERLWAPRRIRPDEAELARPSALLQRAKKPLIIAGGGVLYSRRRGRLADFADAHRHSRSRRPRPASRACPSIIRRRIGRGRRHRHGRRERARARRPTSCSPSARACRISPPAPGRCSRIRTGASSPSTCRPSMPASMARMPLVADARAGLELLAKALGSWRRRRGLDAPRAAKNASAGADVASRYTAPTNAELPSDAQVIGAVQRASERSRHRRLRRGRAAGRAAQALAGGRALGYHLEYGFSCMGYEIAGGLGVKMAQPDREVVVMVGDGSYLMMNSEIATSVMLGRKLTIVVLDNRGFGCINRLQRATGGESFNNLFEHTEHVTLPEIDFAAHAASLGAIAREGRRACRPRSGAARGAQGGAHERHRHRHRSAMTRPMPAAIGGMSRCRKCPARGSAGRAQAYEEALEAQRID